MKCPRSGSDDTSIEFPAATTSEIHRTSGFHKCAAEKNKLLTASRRSVGGRLKNAFRKLAKFPGRSRQKGSHHTTYPNVSLHEVQADEMSPVERVTGHNSEDSSDEGVYAGTSLHSSASSPPERRYGRGSVSVRSSLSSIASSVLIPPSPCAPNARIAAELNEEQTTSDIDQ